jgi:hypothetical protein
MPSTQPGLEALFITEGDERVDSRGAMRWEQAGGKANNHHEGQNVNIASQ